MSEPKTTIGLAVCPSCSDIHLVVVQVSNGEILYSKPLSRAEWAGLIGAYTDLVVMQDKDIFVREGGRVQ